MPELPEVETIRRDLQRVVLRKLIARVVVRKPKLVRGSVRLLQRLKGQTFTAIARRGKLLIFSLDDGKRFMLLHLKMTGQLIYSEDQRMVAGGHSFPAVEAVPNKYTHIEWHFTDGSALYFNDLRQFGFVAVVDGIERERVAAAYGVEPLSRAFTVERLREILKGRKVSVKQVLLDQTKIAGLGNIYVDEACFRARVKPQRLAESLDVAEVRRLHRAIREVLMLALKYRGTTFNNFRDAYGRTGNFVRRLKVYGRGGEACRRCGERLVRVKAGGRGTVFCPVCQK